MRGRHFYASTTLATLFVCALIAGGCGDDDDETTTSTSAEQSAEQKVDAAVSSCSD